MGLLIGGHKPDFGSRRSCLSLGGSFHQAPSLCLSTSLQLLSLPLTSGSKTPSLTLVLRQRSAVAWIHLVKSLSFQGGFLPGGGVGVGSGSVEESERGPTRDLAPSPPGLPDCRRQPSCFPLGLAAHSP